MNIRLNSSEHDQNAGFFDTCASTFEKTQCVSPNLNTFYVSGCDIPSSSSSSSSSNGEYPAFPSPLVHSCNGDLNLKHWDTVIASSNKTQREFQPKELRCDIRFTKKVILMTRCYHKMAYHRFFDDLFGIANIEKRFNFLGDRDIQILALDGFPKGDFWELIGMLYSDHRVMQIPDIFSNWNNQAFLEELESAGVIISDSLKKSGSVPSMACFDYAAAMPGISIYVY